MNNPESSRFSFKHANLTIPQAYESVWNAANMALASAPLKSEGVNAQISERIASLFGGIDAVATENELITSAMPNIKRVKPRVNLGFLFSKAESISRSIHGDPDYHDVDNPFLIDDESYLATQALELYLQAAYSELK